MIKKLFSLYWWAEKIWFKLPQKLRFLLVGGFNTVFAFCILAVLIETAKFVNNIANWGLNETILANISLFIQYIITINVSFLTMRYYVFQSKGNWRKEFAKAWSVYVMMYLINAPILTFLMEIVGLPALVAQAIYIIFATVITFLLHKYFSFRQKAIN